MKQTIILQGLLFIATLGFSQHIGIVKSLETKEAVSGAFVLAESGNSCYTDAHGKFSLKMIQQNERITIVAAGYLNFYGKIQDANQDYFLTPSFNVQNPLEIKAGPSIVFQSETWNVGDFIWDKNGAINLLIYEKEKRWKRQEDANRTIFENAKIAFIGDTLQKQWVSISMNENAIGFYHSFPGEVIVEGENDHYLKVEDQLALLPDSIFNPYFKPVVEKLNTDDFLVSDYQKDYPSFSYYRAMKDSAWIPLQLIQDEKEMELFRSEYKYLGPREKLEAFQFELDNKIDKEIVGAYMSGFSSKPYHNPIYAPLIVMGDTIMVFDHIHNQVSMYHSDGTLLKKRPCSHHLQKGTGKWMEQVWKDGISNKMYTAYEKGGRVKWFEINKDLDIIRPCMELAYRYCERINVRNGEVFFIYRPFESSQKRYLYKQKITHE